MIVAASTAPILALRPKALNQHCLKKFVCRHREWNNLLHAHRNAAQTLPLGPKILAAKIDKKHRHSFFRRTVCA